MNDLDQTIDTKQAEIKNSEQRESRKTKTENKILTQCLPFWSINVFELKMESQLGEKSNEWGQSLFTVKNITEDKYEFPHQIRLISWSYRSWDTMLLEVQSV